MNELPDDLRWLENPTPDDLRAVAEGHHGRALQLAFQAGFQFAKVVLMTELSKPIA
jgi:hypothetical protein